MATVKGVNRTLLDNPIGSNIVGTGLNNAQINCIYDEYEAAAIAAGDVVKLGGLVPQGATIVRIDLLTDDLGVGTTADVGDSTTVDRYINGADTATAAALASWPNAVQIGAVGAYKIGTNSGDGQIQLTNLGAAATGTIKIWIYYSL